MGADPKFSQSTDKGLEARCDSLEAGCDSLEDVLHLLQIWSNESGSEVHSEYQHKLGSQLWFISAAVCSYCGSKVQSEYWHSLWSQLWLFQLQIRTNESGYKV